MARTDRASTPKPPASRDVRVCVWDVRFDDAGADTPSVQVMRHVRIHAGGSVALADRMIEAGLIYEVWCSPSPVLAAEDRVCRVPVSTGGDRGRGAVVPAV